MEKIKGTSYPEKITVYGVELTKVGSGLYPYDCISKDEHPKAMIYENKEKMCWSAAILVK